MGGRCRRAKNVNDRTPPGATSAHVRDCHEHVECDGARPLGRKVILFSAHANCRWHQDVPGSPCSLCSTACTFCSRFRYSQSQLCSWVGRTFPAKVTHMRSWLLAACSAAVCAAPEHFCPGLPNPNPRQAISRTLPHCTRALHCFGARHDPVTPRKLSISSSLATCQPRSSVSC